jgi:hypothetical protein
LNVCGTNNFSLRKLNRLGILENRLLRKMKWGGSTSRQEEITSRSDPLYVYIYIHTYIHVYIYIYIYIYINWLSSVWPRGGLYGRAMWRTEKQANCIQDFGSESEGLRSHGGPTCGWENNITNLYSETGQQAVDWI